MNGLKIIGTFENDVEIEFTSINNRNETVAYMAPNMENELELTITEDSTGEFYQAWKKKDADSNSFNCPTKTEFGDTEKPSQPSDFNHFKCCDFTMIRQGMSVDRLFKDDNHCNDTNFKDGVTGSYPYPEAPVTLCYTKGGGGYDTLPNPVCDIWRNKGMPMPAMDNMQPKPETEKSEIKCRVGNQIKTNTNGGTVYEQKYTFPINSGESGLKTTLKVVACSYQSTLPGAQISAHTTEPSKSTNVNASPIFSITYGSKVTDNACKTTDTTKCTDPECLAKGLVNMLQDTSEQITSKDCTTFETVKDTDNPNYPFCSRHSDCPSKSCKLTIWTKYLPYNESIVNETLINEMNTRYGGSTKSISCTHNTVTGTVATYNVTNTDSNNVTTTTVVNRAAIVSAVQFARQGNGTGTCQAPAQKLTL